VITLRDSAYEIEPIVSFSTIEEFWDYFLQLPPLSSLKCGGIALFKEGIQPAWEDQNNLGGVTFRLLDFTGPRPQAWETLLISAISGTIESRIGRGELCGIQAVVKPGGRWGVDLWFQKFPSASAERAAEMPLRKMFGPVKVIRRK
jgi:hypothetical protein